MKKLNQILRKLYRRWLVPKAAFTNSASYWQNRYKAGGHSGDGSYGKLAAFKAKIINEFVQENKIQTIIEYGCGDGNQLKFANYPSYIGFDVSDVIIKKCINVFKKDASKAFKLMTKYAGEKAELCLSLDVIFHLIEEDVFDTYMQRLMDSSEKFVIIYSSNTDKNQLNQSPHFKNRHFSKWIDKNRPSWVLESHISNNFPFTGDEVNGSVSDFYIYQKIS